MTIEMTLTYIHTYILPQFALLYTKIISEYVNRNSDRRDVIAGPHGEAVGGSGQRRGVQDDQLRGGRTVEGPQQVWTLAPTPGPAQSPARTDTRGPDPRGLPRPVPLHRQRTCLKPRSGRLRELAALFSLSIRLGV